MYSYIWVYMSMNGYVFGIYGYIWVCMGIMVLSRYLWVYIGMYQYVLPLTRKSTVGVTSDNYLTILDQTHNINSYT